MSSAAYQKQAHRPIDFKPFVASRDEEAMAEARRKARESSRREEMKTVYPKPTKRPMLDLSSEWGPGSEMYCESWKAVVPGEGEEVEGRGDGADEGRKSRRRIVTTDEN